MHTFLEIAFSSDEFYLWEFIILLLLKIKEYNIFHMKTFR